MQPGSRIRVAIVEDDPVIREELARIVGASPDMEVVGEAGTLEAGRRLVAPKAGEPPDIVLLDLALPDGEGLALIRELQANEKRPRIVVVSIFGDARNVVAAIEAGADGYLLKGADSAEAAAAIRSVMGGGAPISPAVASHILARMRKRDAAVEADAPSLSEKEVAILGDLAKGFRYKEVARLHGISINTVGDHVKAIYRKLAVNSRSEAVFEAVQAGLIQLKD